MPTKPKKKEEKDKYPKVETANFHFKNGKVRSITKRGIKGQVEQARRTGAKFFICKNEEINLKEVEYINYEFQG